jgi:predicted Zn-dependent protease
VKVKNISLIIAMGLCLGTVAQSPSVTIKEEMMSLETYDFDKPNPVPILTDNAKIFPYFKYEGYENIAKKKNWKVVTLENEFIKVFVLPEIGGKVWGAIEKSTGEEFLYKNEVIKFRNISMRGPWTSGGIEFNFGIIGHHPSTATPVDYLVKTNEDGSVSCIVGSTDLPSDTDWRVEIRLEKDKAYFETNASWYNGSPMDQSYYNWMTAAAVVSDDLEFIYPGNQFLEHGGAAKPWPIDAEGRDLSLYKNNNFDKDISEHVVGDYKDFFGGYYHNRNFGFGHWAPYEEMPGQKLWLWSMARSGGIWEDLLTDSDGQYMEFQAGRLLNQYSPGETNPISQANFEPYVMDRWKEIWFPFKEIGGMVDATEYGVLNVKESDKGLYIGINALQSLRDNLTVSISGKEVYSEEIALKPMGIFSKVLPLGHSGEIVVQLGDKKLFYTSNGESTLIKRPFIDDEAVKVSKSEQLYHEGWEALKFRDYELAAKKLNELVASDPSHKDGLLKLAGLEYRKTNYDKALEYVNRVLKLDTYNTEANYLAGIIYRSLNDNINALESLGWAARSIKYRSVSYAQMAEIYFSTQNEERADLYANKALDYNSYNLNARKIKLLLQSKNNRSNAFNVEYEELIKIDPLNHFALIESQFLSGRTPLIMPKEISNEFPDESILELAIYYKEMGLVSEAMEILKLSRTSNAKIHLWAAYLTQDMAAGPNNEYLAKAIAAPVDFVFPYRPETIAVLKWAISQNANWKFKYYLAQNYMAVGQKALGLQLLKDCGNEPDSDIFYRFRARMFENEDYVANEKDYLKALQINSSDWKLKEEVVQFYLDNNKIEQAYKLAKKSYAKYPNNANIGLIYAKSSLLNDQYGKTIEVLKDIMILPFEHASESKKIYTEAHILMALDNMKAKNYKRAISFLEASKEWPENLGVGKPFHPDERLQDYLLAVNFEMLRDSKKSEALLTGILSYQNNNNQKVVSPNELFELLSLKKLGRSAELESAINRITNIKTSAMGELVLALYRNDTSAMQEIRNQNVLKNSSLKIMEAASKY